VIRVAVISALVASPVAAAGLGDCAFSEGHHAARAHRDIGGGVVSYEQSFMTADAGEAQHVVEHCASGDRVITVLRDLRRSGPDHTVGVRTAFEQMASGKARHGLPEVVARMRDLGAQSALARLDRESCACAMAYPRARGTKTPWQRPGG
jgi:hypothetical protein